VTNSKTDILELLDYSISFATKMLTDFQEFFPFAATINEEGFLVPTAYLDSNERPLSNDLINKLELQLERQLSNRESRAYALTFDVKVKPANDTEAKDAIAIRIKHVDQNDINVYYYTYLLTDRNVELIDSWGETV
jgi:hypothetical protein